MHKKQGMIKMAKQDKNHMECAQAGGGNNTCKQIISCAAQQNLATMKIVLKFTSKINRNLL